MGSVFKGCVDEVVFVRGCICGGGIYGERYLRVVFMRLYL